MTDLIGRFQYSYAGDTALGVGFFEITEAGVRGGDWLGLTFEGTVAVEPDSSLLATLLFHIPPHLDTLTGAASLVGRDAGPVEVRLPPNFDKSPPVEMQLPPRPVWITIRRLEEDLAALATPEGLAAFVTAFAAASQTVFEGPK